MGDLQKTGAAAAVKGACRFGGETLAVAGPHPADLATCSPRLGSPGHQPSTRRPRRREHLQPALHRGDRPPRGPRVRRGSPGGPPGGVRQPLGGGEDGGVVRPRERGDRGDRVVSPVHPQGDPGAAEAAVLAAARAEAGADPAAGGRAAGAAGRRGDPGGAQAAADAHGERGGRCAVGGRRMPRLPGADAPGGDRAGAPAAHLRPGRPRPRHRLPRRPVRESRGGLAPIRAGGRALPLLCCVAYPQAVHRPDHFVSLSLHRRTAPRSRTA